MSWDWNLYLVGQKFIVPTSAKAVAGFYVASEPVFVASINSLDECSSALEKALQAENIIVPNPDWKNRKPVVLGPAGVKTWSAFFKKAICWRVKKSDGFYVLARCERIPGHQAFGEGDPEHGAAIPDSNDLKDVSRQIIAAVLTNASP